MHMCAGQGDTLVHQALERQSQADPWSSLLIDQPEWGMEAGWGGGWNLRMTPRVGVVL